MRKQHAVKVLAAIAAVSMSGVIHAGAADVTAGADVNSAYVWRGITFNDGFVAQPSVDVTGPAGLGFNVWGNYDLESYDVDGEEVVGSGDFSEVDLTLSYAIPVEGFDLSAGVIEYLYPAGADGSREVYLDSGFDLGGGFGLQAFVAYDFDEVDDVYGHLSLSYGYDVDENLSLGAEGRIGAAGSDFAGAYGGEDGGLFDWQAKVSADYAVSEATSLGAFVAYTDAVDSDALVDQDVDIYGGVNAYYSF